MKNFMIGMSAVIVLFTMAAKTGVAQDLMKVAPTIGKVVFENDKVRLIDVWVKKGEKVAMHSHPDHILYFMSDGKMKTSFPDGTTKETEGKAGNAVWTNAVTHANENIGMTDIHALLIEFKGSETKSEMKK